MCSKSLLLHVITVSAFTSEKFPFFIKYSLYSSLVIVDNTVYR